MEIPWIILVSVLIISSTIEAASYLYLDARMNYNQGIALCRKFHLTLAIARSQQDMDDLKSLYSTVSGTTSAWLGIQYDGTKFLLPDKSVMEYENWNNVADDEPDDLPRSSCAVVARSHFMWHTRRCSQLNNVLCGPYDQPGVIQDIRLTSFLIWKQDKSFLTVATSIHSGSSLRACANACLVRGNCMFFSIQETTCSTYINIDKLSIGDKQGSVIWRKNTIIL